MLNSHRLLSSWWRIQNATTYLLYLLSCQRLNCFRIKLKVFLKEKVKKCFKTLAAHIRSTYIWKETKSNLSWFIKVQFLAEKYNRKHRTILGGVFHLVLPYQCIFSQLSYRIKKRMQNGIWKIGPLWMHDAIVYKRSKTTWFDICTYCSKLKFFW